MKNHKTEYDKIKLMKPKRRGFEFEKLINKIFDEHQILIRSSYRTAELGHQIDGAIQIHGKIFLLEAKWEKKETLAASKFYMFYGKVVSKIEGTLGVFISHERLKDNFLNALRGGMRQTCIVIHGEENVVNIIEGKVNVKDFIWYCHQMASTHGYKEVDVSEFADLPNSRLTALGFSVSANKTNWTSIYDPITDTKIGDAEYANFLEENIDETTSFSKNFISVLPTIYTDFNSKTHLLLNKLSIEEKATFSNAAYLKLQGYEWKKYSRPLIASLLQGKLQFEIDKRKKIIENITSVINGDWEDENRASVIIELFYDQLIEDELMALANKYLDIYCDSTGRENRFQQKKTANKIFGDLVKARHNPLEVVLVPIRKYISELIQTKTYYGEDTGAEKYKKWVIGQTINRYLPVYSYNPKENLVMLEEIYDELHRSVNKDNK